MPIINIFLSTATFQKQSLPQHHKDVHISSKIVFCFSNLIHFHVILSYVIPERAS